MDETDPPQALLNTLGFTQGQQEVTTTYKFFAKGLDQPAMTVVFAEGAPFPAVTVAGSIRDINSVVEEVANQFNVDLAKVYATGISNGGFMTTALACELPERFAAVAMAAGSFPCERSRPIPTFIIHGTDDLLVPFGGDPNFDLPPVRQTAAGYAVQNGCTATPDSTDLPDIDPNDGTTITKFTYSGPRSKRYFSRQTGILVVDDEKRPDEI